MVRRKLDTVSITFTNLAQRRQIETWKTCSSAAANIGRIALTHSRDLLFSSDSVFAWRAERDFKELKASQSSVEDRNMGKGGIVAGDA